MRVVLSCSHYNVSDLLLQIPTFNMFMQRVTCRMLYKVCMHEMCAVLFAARTGSRQRRKEREGLSHARSESLVQYLRSTHLAVHCIPGSQSAFGRRGVGLPFVVVVVVIVTMTTMVTMMLCVLPPHMAVSEPVRGP